MSDYKTPIVLDTGSGLMKAGFADQDLPATVFPTVIGRPKYEVHAFSCFTGVHCVHVDQANLNCWIVYNVTLCNYHGFNPVDMSIRHEVVINSMILCAAVL